MPRQIAGRAVADDLEQIEPLVGIGEIVAGAETPAGRAEIETGGDLDETLGPGEALELDVGLAPHGAAAAIGADGVAPAQRLGFAAGIDHGDVDVVGALHEARHLGGEADLGDPAPLDTRLRRPHQLVLLPLHHERVRHFALEQIEVEHGDELAAHAVAEVEDRRLQSAAGVVRKGFVLEPELGQHFDGRRVNGGGALILGRLGLALQQRDRNALLDQCERRHRAHRPGADHDHAIVMLHDQLQTAAPYTAECATIAAC